MGLISNCCLYTHSLLKVLRNFFPVISLRNLGKITHPASYIWNKEWYKVFFSHRRWGTQEPNGPTGMRWLFSDDYSEMTIQWLTWVRKKIIRYFLQMFTGTLPLYFSHLLHKEPPGKEISLVGNSVIPNTGLVLD